MARQPLRVGMHVQGATRVALARLFAIRHGRDVPLVEIEREVVAEGFERALVEPTLRALQERRLAVLTAQGWRPAAHPPQSRAHEPMAQFSWLHA